MLAPDFSSRRARGAPASNNRDRWLALAAALLLLLAVYSAVSAHADLAAAQTSVARARGEAETAAAQAEKLRSGPEQARLARVALSRLAAPPRVLAALEALLPGDARLDSINIVYGATLELDLRVIAKSAAAYDLFLERLTASPLFTRVAPGEENREGEIQSQLHATYVGGG